MNKLKIGILSLVLSCLFFVSPSHSYATETAKTWFYIDGQEQRYVGEPVKINGEWWLPLRPVLMEAALFNEELNDGYRYVQKIIRVLNEERKKESLADEDSRIESIDSIENREMTEEEKEHEEILSFLSGFSLDYFQNRDVIRLADVGKLGFDYYMYQDAGIIHLNSPGLMELAGLSIGLNKEQVNGVLGAIHWNTGYGMTADYVGFYGSENEFTYRDRYGHERTEKAFDLQIEITDNALSHLIVSNAGYETSKGISVGDRLNDAIRAYGNQYVRESIDGKQVIIYDVEFGSIWFIAGSDQSIERIGYWDHQLRGFGDSQQEEIEGAEEIFN
ncbi:hypothetical protein PQ478_16050 [Alkalihalophilus pseudofirmus]|uniref:hypothetical protein n=1 Tax=Alkalihalophilus pseudofirmus TaxID=79885 RepID=UPI00259B0BA8|nr:hypothetical protein [Alkalihalophilus pseudofirmus]WEG16010.1 hypothetical protein PQ478_16050 [Alkalihalophilus pseudofirmus]